MFQDSHSVEIIEGDQTATLPLELKLEEIKPQRDAKGLESAFQTAKKKQVSAITRMADRPFFRRKKADHRA
jgi:hypothetical protein